MIRRKEGRFMQGHELLVAASWRRPMRSRCEFSTCYAAKGMLEPYQLGRYSCFERIGDGPHTEAFRARLHGVAGIEREFAIKRLREPWASDSHARRRFILAGNALMPFDDPRVVKVLDARDLADGCFV